LRGWLLSASFIGVASSESSRGATRATTSAKSLHAEPGSFRDPDSRVFYDGAGNVVRSLSPDGLDGWEALASSQLYERYVDSGRLVRSEVIDSGQFGPNGSSTLLRHERIPFISYPYEWPFSMLRAAALLQLDLIGAALDEGLILKDATPYNIQWRGVDPVFIDVGSFERFRPGETWVGYRQFCMLFLYPLLLQAYRGIPFNPLLRGTLDGIEPAVCRRLLSPRDYLRRGVLSHVVVHERLERRNGDRSAQVRSDLKDAGFDKDLIRANVRRLRRLVSRLERPKAHSAWSDYGSSNSYSDDEAQRKGEVVRAAAERVRPPLAWDIGCNDARYSRIVAEHAAYTLAIDADHVTVDRVFRALSEEGASSIQPLVLDIADPSPGLGWRNVERKTLAERGKPELVLCLAVIHHLVITRNIPLRSFLEWLWSLDSVVLIEFPDENDEMVRRLLDAKRPGLHEDYRRPNFEQLLPELFEIEEAVALSPTRTVYRIRPRQ
jgi:hypothetical protein